MLIFISGMHYFMSLSSFIIILTGKREQFALRLMSFGCLVTVNVMWLFLMMTYVGLDFFIVVFPDHTHLHFVRTFKSC